ncbi:hypothetical protein ROZALSC1DRAFT_21710, partial [Rozella allomycis CSF55]
IWAKNSSDQVHLLNQFICKYDIINLKTIDEAIKFVSRIKINELSNPYEIDIINAIENGWANSNESAILLMSILTSISKQAFGFCGYSYGKPRIFVLLNENDCDCLIDPITGIKYNLKDPLTPFTKIGFVFDCDNIWFNLQKNDTPWQIDIDFLKENEWKSFKTNNSINVIKELKFVKDESYQIELSNEIKFKVVRLVEDFRKTTPTRWNRFLSQTLENIIAASNDSYSKFQVELKSDKVFSKVLESHTWIGFMKQFNFSNTDEIIEYISLLDIYDSFAKFDIHHDFIVSVFTFTYTQNISSIWIILGALKPNK